MSKRREVHESSSLPGPDTASSIEALSLREVVVRAERVVAVIPFATDVHIERPLEEVFAYASEPLNVPRRNSAVEVVRETLAREGGVGSTYVMERELPTGRRSTGSTLWPATRHVRSRSARAPARRRSSIVTGSPRRTAKQS